MMRVSDEAKKALDAMDSMGNKIPAKPQDQAALLIELNKILDLLSIRYKLKSGWGKYISDEAVRRFGKTKPIIR